MQRTGSTSRLIEQYPATTPTAGQPADVSRSTIAEPAHVSIHMPSEENKAGSAAGREAQPGIFNRGWFGAQRCEYGKSCLKSTWSFVTSIATGAGKGASSTAAGALSLSQLALVLYATGNPEIAAATVGAGALTGAMAHVTHHFKSTQECSQFFMKLLGTAQRFQQVAAGSAPWAARFAGMMQSYALTQAVKDSLGGVYGEAAHEGAFRAVLTTGVLMGISDACGMVQVCNSAVQELAAWAAYHGDTPLMLPDLAGSASNLQKGVTYGFSGAAAAEAMNSAQHLRPGLQMPNPQNFNAMVIEPATSAMFNSSALGFLVAAISFHYSVDMEGSDWIDCSKKINESIDAVENHFKATAEATARKDKFGDKPLKELCEEERAELQQVQREAVQAEKAARSCCATLGKTLEGISKKLTGEYVRVVGGTMDMATVSPFRNCSNCLGESRVAQTIGLVCRALTTPAAAIGGFAAMQTLLPQLDDSPALQRSVMMAGYAEYTLFWLGTLLPWHEARTDPAMDELRSTERTLQSELFRAGLITVGTGALSLIADHLLDEAIDGRHSANQWNDVSGFVLMGAGMIGMGAHLLANCVRPSGVDTERAFDATLALAIGSAVGALDGEQYGAYTAAAVVMVGQLAAVAQRMQRIKREGGDGEGDIARAAAAKNKSTRAAAASAKREDATRKELATKTPEQQQQALLDGMVKMAHAAKLSQHLDRQNAAAAVERSVATLPEGERQAARANVRAFLEMFREMPDQPAQMAFHTIPVDLSGKPQIQRPFPSAMQSSGFSNGSGSPSSSSSSSSSSSAGMAYEAKHNSWDAVPNSTSSSSATTAQGAAKAPDNVRYSLRDSEEEAVNDHEDIDPPQTAQPTVRLHLPDPMPMPGPPDSPSLTGLAPPLD